ncbi:MAG: aminotransferase class I/II-fold pyridoxal phosphate-dependent enzyme [Beutenbergiaceae bacterium]
MGRSRTPEGRWHAAAVAAGLVGGDGALRPTIFAEMSALATETGAINLGQGYPDQDGPASVKEAARQAIADGVNQYPPGRGNPELRQAIAEHQRRHYQIDLDPETEVLVTTGATEALAAAILAFAQPGSTVVTLEPFYDAYAAMIAVAGAEHVRVPMRATASGFSLDLGALRSAITPTTSLMVLNSPHNPTGAVLSATELAALAQLALEHDVVVITDEVYEHLTFDGATHIPMATLASMAERTLTISSIGKTFSFTGWKIGWISGPAHLIDAVQSVKQFLTYVSGAPFQPAAAHALNLETTEDAEASYVQDLAQSLAGRRDLLAAGLERAGLPIIPSQGTYFLVADASAITAAAGLPDAAALCRALPQLCGVVAIAMTAFTRPGSSVAQAVRHQVRFTFTKSEATLGAAVDRLQLLAR